MKKQTLAEEGTAAANDGYFRIHRRKRLANRDLRFHSNGLSVCYHNDCKLRAQA